MRKLKETIDKIKLDDYEREKMLHRILNHEEEKKRDKKAFLPRLAMFFLAFILVTGSCYALAKVFQIDDKFKFLFGKTDEELYEYGISGSAVSKTKEFTDAKITIQQTILDEKEIYIMLEVEGKEENIYLEEAYLSSGNSFDETILNQVKNQEEIDSMEIHCSETQKYGCYSRGLAFVNEKDRKTGYAISISIDGKLKEKEEVTLRLVSTKGKNYDIPFTLYKNEIKIKENKNVQIVYEEGNLVVSVKEVRVTPLHIIVDFNYSKPIENLSEEKQASLFANVFNENGTSDTYVTYKDGATSILRLEGNNLSTMSGGIGTKEEQIKNIESVKSVTIHGVAFSFEK